MEVGEKCICQHDDWVNAFGEKNTILKMGMRLTVLGSRKIHGITFYSFEETPEDNLFMYDGFKSMRNLN